MNHLLLIKLRGILHLIDLNMVKLGFYIWPAFSLFLVVMILRYSEDKQSLLKRFAIFLMFWLSYLIVLTNSNVLNDYTVPPKVPLLVIVPVIALIIFFTGTKRFQSLYQRTPKHIPVYFQSFRIIVEFLIYGAYLEGSFAKFSTFEGLNYDIIVGISAILIGFLVQKKIMGSSGLLIWNILSLIVLTVTAYSFLYVYYFSDWLDNGGSTDFVTMPYFLLAGILLPVAIFLHVFSIRQLRGKKMADSANGLH